jgi:hypothetical protein
MRRRKIIIQRKTFLLIVEGDTELAFALYLKSVLSRERNLAIKIENARGRGPDAVIDYALRRHSVYDHVAIAYDGDLPISQKSQKSLQEMTAITLVSTPCIEGFFLKVLEKRVPENSKKCKKEFEKLYLSKKEKLERDNYQRIFPPEDMTEFCRDPDFKRWYDLFSNNADI